MSLRESLTCWKECGIKVLVVKQCKVYKVVVGGADIITRDSTSIHTYIGRRTRSRRQVRKFVLLDSLGSYYMT